ncbi:MAG: hypothetical protein JW726_00780 [Anaerolineales bacterium]|nr:hypothetical protein [Anaerolineales bacterium]
MSQKNDGGNPIRRLWRSLEKEGSAIARGGPWVRVAFLSLLLVLIFLCLLIFSSDILSFDVGLLERVQNVRLTIKPYTPTVTVTPTKKPTLTLTPTITLTPTGKLPSPTITPTFFTPTFTVTSTPTRPNVPLQTLRPDSTYEWQERLRDTWLWRHLYAIAVGVALATWLVVLYIRDVYRIRRSVLSAGLLMRMLFVLPIGTIHIRGGNFVDIQVRKYWVIHHGSIGDDVQNMPVGKRKGKTDKQPQVLAKDRTIERTAGRIIGRYQQIIEKEVRIVRKDWVLVTPGGMIIYKNNDQPLMANSLRRTLRLLRVGIPARLIVDQDSCVVIEGSQKQSLVIGPTGEKGELLLGFSRVRRGVDLRDAAVKLNVRQPTSDGVPLSVDDFQLVFSVFRDGRMVQGDTYPYVEEAIFNLVYRFWLDGEWLPEMTARITAELRQFITKHPLDTFLPYLWPDQVAPANLNQASNPFSSFVNQFNAQARTRGIQIHWQGEGKWRLPTEADLTEQLVSWQKNIESLLKLPEQLSDQPIGGEYNQNLITLIQQVPLALLEPLMLPNLTTRAMLVVVEAYRDRLNEVLQLYQQRERTPPSELVAVIDHLNRLILRRIGGS